jgi:thiol:disulfide interchange protein DsbC
MMLLLKEMQMRKTIISKAIISMVLLMGIQICHADTLRPTGIPTLYENFNQGNYQDKAGHYFLSGVLLDLGQTQQGSERATYTLEEVATNVSKRLQIYPTLVERTPIAGIYAVVFNDLIKYTDGSGRFIFRGATLKDRQGNDLGTQILQRATVVQGKKNLGALTGISEQEMIIYKSPNERTHITVFTDTDCPFCYKLHQDVDRYLQKGVTVRYLFFPREGKGSASYNDAISVWCNDNQQQALDDVENGHKVAPQRCRHPVDKHLVAVKRLNLMGTPVIMLEDGRLMHGYYPAHEVLGAIR